MDRKFDLRHRWISDCGLGHPNRVPFVQNTIHALENITTLVIQAMDLGLILPLTFLSGILLLRRSAWGYLLSSVTLLKGITMGLGVSAMGINMALRGMPDSLGILVPFLMIMLFNLITAGLMLKHIGPGQSLSHIA